MQKSLFPLLCLAFSACANYHNTATKTDENGKHTFACAAENVSVQYYGDYVLHDFTKSKTLFWNANFVKTLPIKNAKSKFLYAAHTTIAPFIQSVGFLYKNASLTQITAAATTNLKRQNARNINVSTIAINGDSYTKITYNLPNASLKISENYADYYTKTENNVLRIAFIHLDDIAEKVVLDESQNILANVRKKP